MDKKAIWSGWYQQLTPLVQNYTENLQLVQTAATANGENVNIINEDIQFS